VKRLTEQQLRNVIRQELRNYLIEQQEEQKSKTSSKFRNLIIPAIAAALMMVPGHQMTAMGSEGKDSSGGKTIEQILDEAGVTEKVLGELNVDLKEEDIEKFATLFKTQKQLQNKLDKLKEEGGSEEDIKELTRQVDNVFSANNIKPDELERMQKTGSAIFKYIKSATPEQLEAYEELTPENTKLLQKNALMRSISQAGQQEDVKDALVHDLTQLVNIAKQDPVAATAQTGAEAVIIFAANNNLIPQGQTEFNYLDVIKAASDRNYGEYFLVDPKNFTDRQLNDLDGKLDTMTVQDANATLQKAKQIQENKVNKLRQKLNELRGVYV